MMHIKMKLFLSCYGLVFFLHFATSWSDMQLTGITNSVGYLETSFKVNRMNKTTYVMNGSFKITEDFSNDYDIKMSIYYSPMGNNQYMLLPFSFATSPLCEFMDGLYRRAFSELVAECSTLPKQVDDQPLCPLYAKGTYNLTNYPFDQKHFSKQVYQDGLYKFEFAFTKRSSKVVASRLTLHIKLV